MIRSSGGSVEEHERERRGPLRVLSGSPEKRIMVLGCGVRLGLPGFDHAIAGSVEQHKNSSGQNRLLLLLSHYARHLSLHHSLFPFLISFYAQSHPRLFFFLPAFLSLSLSPSLMLSLFLSSSSFSSLRQPNTKWTHTHPCTHACTHACTHTHAQLQFDQQAVSAFIWINWQWF